MLQKFNFVLANNLPAEAEDGTLIVHGNALYLGQGKSISLKPLHNYVVFETELDRYKADLAPNSFVYVEETKNLYHYNKLRNWNTINSSCNLKDGTCSPVNEFINDKQVYKLIHTLTPYDAFRINNVKAVISIHCIAYAGDTVLHLSPGMTNQFYTPVVSLKDGVLIGKIEHAMIYTHNYTPISKITWVAEILPC